ncbi:Uncharacterized membrane protein [Lishizhenia tianjinensis]|uniref:Uncharacterized membrane protein n=1 Tax=Lishizhenia tianjinensis TaxID=477690 RepID=A0A1I6YNZ6_9FLAO|nr:DUF819 family protein [Lishizhenia tianjinensis]SFT52163.1 Uncharacterized membrane protein [Lishizhenia tianjinensis]
MKILLAVLTLILSVNLWSQTEKFVVVEKDSLLLLSSEIPNEVLKDSESKDYSFKGMEFTASPYFYLNFTDEDRRVIAKADSVQVIFNKDTSYFADFGNAVFRNPGPNGIISIAIHPFIKGESQALKSSEGNFKMSFLEKEVHEPMIKNDKVVFGLLLVILAFVFYTSNSNNSIWKKFYTVIPALFMCYMLPAALSSLGIISGEFSGLYHMASRYLLPASLILLILSMDLKGLVKLGPKSFIMFVTGTVGVIVGGVFAVWIFSFISPETVGGTGNEATWRGLSTIAGSWIGGGANQTAMLEVYKYKETLFGGMVLVDIVVANIWMAVILFGIGKRSKIDKWLKADNTAIDDLVVRVEKMNAEMERKATLKDYMIMFGIVFIGVGLAHFLGDVLSSFFETILEPGSTLRSQFFWMVVLATMYGLILSFTKARQYEGVGASKFGSIFLYVLVATIGMKVDISAIFSKPLLIFVGLIWIAVHAGLLILVAKLIRAPFFFLAVGSQANIGGAASAPVVANAFHPALTTVGVIMAVVGYFFGTWGALICAELMSMVAPV